MTALTTKQIHDLNSMNRAGQNATLGTRLASIQSNVQDSGSYTVFSNDGTASKVDFATGLTGLVGYIVNAYTSGSLMTGLKVIPSASGSNLVITAGSTASSSPKSLGTGDIINWIAW